MTALAAAHRTVDAAAPSRHRGAAVWGAALLALWLGGVLLFAAVVAPAAFAVLPTRALAGALVGRVLPVVFYSGMALGVVTVALAARSLSGVARRTAMVGGVAALVSTAAAQLVVGARIERLRAALGGALDALPAGDPRRAEFGQLHGLSVLLLGAAAVALTVALVTFALRAQREGGAG